MVDKCYLLSTGFVLFLLLTLMPSHRETARNGLKALSVRIERNAGMSAAPAIIAPKFISESFYNFLCG